MTKALILHANGKVRHTEIDASLEGLQALVGGPIEYLRVTKGVHAYINEEGKFDPTLLRNERATTLLHNIGGDPSDYVVGDMVLLGMDANGNEADVPEGYITPYTKEA